MNILHWINPKNPMILMRFFTIKSILRLCVCAVCIIQADPVYPQQDSTLFTRLVPGLTGVEFSNRLTETNELNIITYEYFFNGGGVAIGDINNDGLPDLYFSGNMVPNRLYLNKGEMVFEDITGKAGVACEKGWKTGVSMVDINGDGWLDIYVCYSGMGNEKSRRNQLFMNQGNLTFREKAGQYQLDLPDYSTQAAFFDFDNDGDLDMYLLNHNIKENRSLDVAALRAERDPYAGDKLLRNDGGKFTDISAQASIKGNPISFGLGVAVSDVNNDGWPDIYVSNDYRERDYLYINNRDGTFTDRLEEMIGHVSNFSMGSDVADVNNNGWADIFTLDMLPEDNRRRKLLFAPDNYELYQAMLDNGFYHQLMRNMLHLNNGDGTFSEVGQLAGISNTDWSWAGLFADFDNDGLKDLLVTNGYGRDVINRDFMKFYMAEKFKSLRGVENEQLLSVLREIPPTAFANYVYKNMGGLRFRNMIREWGFDHATISSGAAYADLDRDGDLDIVVNNMNEQAGIYRNNAGDLPGRYHLAIALKSHTPNRAGIGAKVYVETEEGLQMQEFYPSRGFQSGMHVPLHFGMRSPVAEGVKIVWPDGKSQELHQVKSGVTLELDHRDAAENKPLQPSSDPARVLRENTELSIDYMHRERKVNDFKIQPLMPNMISYSGPKMAAGDFNGDGHTDLFIGGGAGQAGSLFLQQTDGSFVLSRQSALEKDAGREDAGAVFFDADGDGDPDLFVSRGGFFRDPGEAPVPGGLYFNVLDGVLARRDYALPPMSGSASCVRAADFNGDGHTDLFVGGRVVPGRYPEIPESYLLLNDGEGVFSIVTDSLASGLRYAGMVTDAVWEDINRDGFPDLIVVGEWMPVKIFINREGKLEDRSGDYFSQATEGWWNCLLAGDLDGDGDTDLVAGNLGLNSQVKANETEPVMLHYADFDGNGSVDPIISYYIQGTSYPLASRDEITDQMVSLRKKFPTYDSYANATIGDVLSPEQQKSARILKAALLETVYFENTGDGFQLRKLPAEANFSPVYAIESIDVNDDGYPDLVLGGNLEHTCLKLGKYDAGYGTVLLNDGKGIFSYLPQSASGLRVKGDVRDIKAIKSGGNMRLVFSRNNQAIAVYSVEP